MKKALNLPCLFKVVLDLETLNYSFTSKNQIEYKIAFIDALYLFEGTSFFKEISNVFGLIIENTTSKNAPLDIEVQKTIEEIVSHFFENHQHSIIYLCDSSDKRALTRHRKFNRWYLKSAIKINLVKVDKIITTDEDTNHYVSLIFHKENSFSNLLENAFNEVVDSLQK